MMSANATQAQTVMQQPRISLMPSNAIQQLGRRIAAAVAHLGWAVRPVLAENDRGRSEVLGSCVLLTVDARYFLITAAHVWDHKEIHGRVLYLGTQTKGIEIAGPARWTEAPEGLRKNDKIDLAFVELPAAFVPEADGCLFLTPDMLAVDDVADPTPLTGSHYLMLGYPASQLDSRPPFRSVTPNPLQYATHPLPLGAYPEWGVAEYSHIVLTYDRDTSQGIEGQRTPPDPHGCSGGGLFRLNSLLSYHKGEDKLAGILFEYHKDPRIVIATRIGLAIEGLIRFRPELAGYLPRTRRVDISTEFR